MINEMVRFKVQDYSDRFDLVKALAKSGYFVRVVTEENGLTGPVYYYVDVALANSK